MSKPESILTDAEMHALISGNPFTLGLSIARLKDFIRQVEKDVAAKLAVQEPVAHRFLHPSIKQYVYITDTVPKLKEFEPLYAYPMPTDHFPDVGKMVAQRQEPVAWRVHPFDYGVGVDGAYAITQQEDQMQAWINKGWEVTPLYLAPTLPLEPSDELIAEIKAMADIRLVDGRVELSNVKEIIHAIVHHPICAN